MIYLSDTGRTKPEILWNNSLTGETPIVSSESADGAGLNAFGSATNDYWIPNSLPATLRVSLGEACDCDAFGIAAHDIGSKGAAFTVQGVGPNRENVIPDSEDLTQWVLEGATIIPDATKSPNGTLADKLVESGSNEPHSARLFDFTVDAGQSYTLSVYIKRDATNRNLAVITQDNSGGPTVVAIFNPVTGIVEDGVGTMEALRNGWFRCQTTITTQDTLLRQIKLQLATGTTISYGGNSSSGLFVWGAQLERRASASSYVATSGGSVSSIYYDLFEWVAPEDDSAIYVMFPARNAVNWRVEVTGATPPSIGVMMLGQSLKFPIGITPSYTPLNHATDIELLTNKSIDGNFLGSRIRRSGLNASVSFGAIYQEWIAENIGPFEGHYNLGGTFFVAPVPERLPKDAGYCWRAERAGTLRPTFRDPVFMDVKLDLDGYAG